MIRMIRNPAIAQMAANTGLDFFMLDMEHGVYSMETVSDIMKTARGAGIEGFARVPELSKALVSRVLDAGATGVMVPMVETPEQASRLAGWSKFAPVGNRGLGSVGTHTGFVSVNATQFMPQANRDVLTIAQIETGPAIEAIDEIASVDGIDALLIGPNDLAVSLGVIGQTEGETVGKAIGKVAEACRKHGRIFGMHGSDALLERWIPEGMTLVMSGLDIGLLASGLKSIADKWGAR
jgi:2-keto-3-deoxy-L-rhamnonate aldolase RhmA